MTQIQNKLDIQNSIEDDLAINLRTLPNFFNNYDDIQTITGLLLSILIHGLIALLLVILSALGITFTRFDLPDLPKQDIEFKLVQQESKPPINPNTKIRSDRDSQAGGKHDPKKAISDPTPKGPQAQPKQAQKSKPKVEKQVKQQPKQPPQPVKQQPKPVQKTVQKPVQQQPVQKTVVKEQPAPKAPAKPTAVKAPTTSLKPTIKPTTQTVEKPTAPKTTTAPKSPFAVTVPSSSPTGTTYKPAGTPSSGSSSASGGSGSAPAPRFSASSGSSGAKSGGSGSTVASGSSGSYGSRGSYGGGGTGGNPSPGNPNGKPGIDAIRQPNWGPYMRDLEQRIKRNWTPPKGDSSKRVVIQFSISRDGRLLSKKIVKSSGVPLADRAAMSAIEQTAPFRPLPPEFKGQSVPIEFTFDYNVLNSVMR